MNQNGVVAIGGTRRCAAVVPPCIGEVERGVDGLWYGGTREARAAVALQLKPLRKIRSPPLTTSRFADIAGNAFRVNDVPLSAPVSIW